MAWIISQWVNKEASFLQENIVFNKFDFKWAF